MGTLALETPSFGAFMAEHGKTYSGETLVRREAIYHDNLRKMEMNRAANPEASFVVNKFADLSESEFKQLYRSGYSPRGTCAELAPATDFFAPNQTRVDWYSGWSYFSN
jgi:hypothetical protein